MARPPTWSLVLSWTPLYSQTVDARTVHVQQDDRQNVSSLGATDSRYWTLQQKGMLGSIKPARPMADMLSRTQQGYYIHHNDTLLMTGEVTHLTPQSKRLVVSVLWDYIVNPSDSVQRVTPYWLDIRGCSSSRLSSQVNSQFSLGSPGYRSNFHGEIVAIVGRLQDGGTLLEIKRDGRTECEMKAGYPSFGAGAELRSLDHHHIQQVSGCTLPLMMTPTSLWHLVAHYDTFSYLPRLGYLKNIEPAMGIALIYIRRTDYLNIDAAMEEDNGKWWILNLLRAFLCLATLVTLSGMGLFALRRRPNYPGFHSQNRPMSTGDYCALAFRDDEE
ncbi:hypothetical protein LTR56_000912 [Elasticomyces elasticus]|nr:hypothetical protein LTR56_000912 [Elasticomyces elasticus]